MHKSKHLSKVYLSLGSNSSEAALLLNKAIVLLSEKIGLLVSKSLMYVSQPWGFNSTHNFVNQIVVFSTELKTEQILLSIQNIEDQFKRTKNIHFYSDRDIDIDIVFFDEQVIINSNLCVPHPLMHFRQFILEPMCEIDQDFKHPVLKKTIKEMLASLYLSLPTKPLPTI